jgi:hypothetical protein
VIGADVTEEHLQNPLLLFVSHDRPVVDDGLQPLTLKNYRGSRGLRLELVAFAGVRHRRRSGRVRNNRPDGLYCDA